MQILRVAGYLVPVALAIIGLILSNIALYAGHGQGILEEYALARLNTSMIGTNLTGVIDGGSGDPVFPGPGDDNKNGDNGIKDDEDDSFTDQDTSVSRSVIHLIYDIMRGLFRYTDPTKVTAPEASAMTGLGIPDWYSFHIMAACQGYYLPKKGSNSAQLRTTNCTRSKLGYQFNLTELISNDLQNSGRDVTHRNYSSADLLQQKLDILNNVLPDLAAYYILSVIFCAIAVLTSVASLLSDNHTNSRLNLVSVSISSTALFIGSIMATVSAKESARQVTKVGNEIGIVAQGGERFLGLSWGATVILFIAVLFSFGNTRRTSNVRKREAVAKTPSDNEE